MNAHGLMQPHHEQFLDAHRGWIVSALVLLLVLVSADLAWSQVHGAPTTAAPPGRSTITPPGPPGQPATSSPALNTAAANNPATAVIPSQPPPNPTNTVGQVTPPTSSATGATTASGTPLTTDANGNPVPADTTASTAMTNPDGTTSTAATNSAGAVPATTAGGPQTPPVPSNAVGMPTARSPFVAPAPGTVAPTSAQSQSQSTGR